MKTIRMNPYFSRYVFWVPFALCWLAQTSFGQGESPPEPEKTEVQADSMLPQGIFDLLIRESISEVTITTHFNTFLENKRYKDYLKGEFTFQPTEGVDMTIPVKLRLRGRYRRMKCQFPPLKLKFRKDDLAAHDLNEFNELKLVTHCLDDEATSQDLVAREHLTYCLFNILCEHSFRAQLVDVTYKNVKGKPKKIKGRGILIEDADELAHRMKGQRLDKFGLPDSCFNRRQENLTALFQYMIGNTDWSCNLQRNVELVQLSETDVYAIPYDFDFSGLVSAPYAKPIPELGQTSVRQRIFQGKAANAEELHEATHHFMEKKDEVFNFVNNYDLISTEAKKDIVAYLEEFFAIIESEHAIMENIFPTDDSDKN